jgi:hypothetical protein
MHRLRPLGGSSGRLSFYSPVRSACAPGAMSPAARLDAVISNAAGPNHLASESPNPEGGGCRWLPERVPVFTFPTRPPQRTPGLASWPVLVLLQAGEKFVTMRLRGRVHGQLVEGSWWTGSWLHTQRRKQSLDVARSPQKRDHS